MQRTQVLFLLGHMTVAIADDKVQAMFACFILRASHDSWKKGVGDVWNHQSNEIGLAKDHGACDRVGLVVQLLSLIHISEPTRLGMISYAVFCLKKKKKT